jgi:polyphenol oxidase
LHNNNVLSVKININSSANFSFITYNAFDKFSEITALTTLRCDVIDGLNSTEPCVILPRVIPQIMSSLELPFVVFVAGRQVHAVNVADISTIIIDSSHQSEPVIIPDTDALITAQKGIALAVLTADCLPVFLYDTSNRVAGLVHAGKKGTEREITAIAIKTMMQSYNCNPRNIVALLGVSIGPCCYPVDLWEENRRQLEKQGIREIHNPGICTGCHTELFYSYRVEKGTTGRMISILLMK